MEPIRPAVSAPAQVKPPAAAAYGALPWVREHMSSYQLRRVGVSLRQIGWPLLVFVVCLQAFQILLMGLFV